MFTANTRKRSASGNRKIKMKLSDYSVRCMAVHTNNTMLPVTAVVVHMPNFFNAGKQRSKGKQANQ
jgi:hypothetical protein